MDLLAVKECTDQQFLPPAFLEMSLAQFNQRIEQLKFELGEM